MNLRRWLAAMALVLGCAFQARAQGDEIQVYDGDLAEPAVFNLTWHNNFTPDGEKTPAYPGAITSHHSFNGVSEWAYGVNPWFEAGVYLPLYSHDERIGWKVDGLKLRTLFAAPHAAERRFVYGVNVEYSVNATYWDEKRFTSEVRPIVGWHMGPWDLIVNPIIDTRYDGLKNLEFTPSTRVAYHGLPHWTLALEEYADYGTFGHLKHGGEQGHQLYGVIDYMGAVEIEAGIGVGLTHASDHLQLKLLIARDLNHPKRP